MTVSQDRIRERAHKIWKEQGDDKHKAEDYMELARKMIQEEEELGLPVNPYPINQESEIGKRGR